tara:strand:- start:339 stop:518 length:180 start_codon:yes stop_codon:yes gene_type:complete
LVVSLVSELSHLAQGGFVPLHGRLRPIHIWFGSRPKSGLAASADQQGQWYLSYIDSDTA